jgi:hypothetical protein
MTIAASGWAVVRGAQTIGHTILLTLFAVARSVVPVYFGMRFSLFD